uniref:Uncharacterized protein n=1 Tax=Glossina brevipalpis TaxID=37001 RepID=A0A1A9WPU7_9MUSC
MLSTTLQSLSFNNLFKNFELGSSLVNDILAHNVFKENIKILPYSTLVAFITLKNKLKLHRPFIATMSSEHICLVIHFYIKKKCNKIKKLITPILHIVIPTLSTYIHAFEGKYGSNGQSTYNLRQFGALILSLVCYPTYNMLLKHCKQ